MQDILYIGVPYWKIEIYIEIYVFILLSLSFGALSTYFHDL